MPNQYWIWEIVLFYYAISWFMILLENDLKITYIGMVSILFWPSLMVKLLTMKLIELLPQLRKKTVIVLSVLVVERRLIAQKLLQILLKSLLLLLQQLHRQTHLYLLYLLFIQMKVHLIIIYFILKIQIQFWLIQKLFHKPLSVYQRLVLQMVQQLGLRRVRLCRQMEKLCQDNNKRWLELQLRRNVKKRCLQMVYRLWQLVKLKW